MKEKNLKINAVLNTVKTVSSIIFPLITFPYVSRILLPENIGKINFASSFVSYFTLIASLGIGTYAIRECSARRSDKSALSETASQIFSINIITTIIAYVLMIFTMLLFRDFRAYKTLIIIQSTTILFATLGCDWLNSAMEDFAFITIRTISFQLLSLVLMFSLVHNPDDYIKYVIITVISSSGANIVNIFYRKKYCNVKFVTRMDWNVHFKPIILLFVMILAQTIFSNADITMLGLVKGDTEVGIYSAALKIENIIAQVVSSLALVVMPRMSLYFSEGNYDEINRLLKNVFGVLVFLGFPCIAGAVALSKEIVLIVGGSQYIESALPLSILMFSFGFTLLGGSFLGNMVLLPSKKEKTFMIICCVATAVNVILNLFLIPIGGAVAAAGTTAFCSFLMMVIMVITKDKRITLEYIWKMMLSPAVGSVAIVAFCALVRSWIALDNFYLSVCICIIGSVVIYVLISIVMRNDILFQFTDKIISKVKGDSRGR